MAASLFYELKRHLVQAIPQDLTLGRYSVLPSSNANGGERGQSEGPSRTSLRDCLLSKTFSRIVLVAVAILLLGDILLRTSSTNGMLDKYGWKVARPGEIDNLQKTVENQDIDWTRFAYCQYVTNEAYLCNSLMIFESLKRVGAKADVVMMYPNSWPVDSAEASLSPLIKQRTELLLKARNEYGVHLVPIEVQHFSGESTWADSFTKLLAFNQTQYQRVLSLDSDATVLQPMDELFLLPSAPVAMPRAYWLTNGQLSSQVVLVEPSQFEFQRIIHAMNTKNASDYDMEIVNDLYARDCLILPHRKYDLVTGEFRNAPADHRAYLGSGEEIWDPEKVLKEAKFVHFSDWPMPKPWQPHSEAQKKQAMPECRALAGGKRNCRDQSIWKSVYDDFLRRRETVCGKAYLPTQLES